MFVLAARSRRSGTRAPERLCDERGGVASPWQYGMAKSTVFVTCAAPCSITMRREELMLIRIMYMPLA